jgi:hypothetical protein
VERELLENIIRMRMEIKCFIEGYQALEVLTGVSYEKSLMLYLRG